MRSPLCPIGLPLLAAALLVACAGGARSPASGACLPVAAMRLEVRRHGDEWEPVAWVDDDGLFHQKVNTRDRSVVRIVGDTVVGASGKPGLRCDADRVLHQEGSRFTMRFGADDALADSMDRIYVRDDGMVVGTFLRGGKPQVAPWRVTARLPEQRRTAELLVLLAMMSVDWSF